MSANTSIEWADHTFNPWWGCTRVSAGCANCYAAPFAHRFGVEWGPKASRRPASEVQWNAPRRWNAAAKRAGRRARVFCASMADVFDEAAPEHALSRLFDTIRFTPWLDWQLLTKRPENIRAALPADWGRGYRNVWLGTSVENQQAANERIGKLLAVPARVRFLSCEPLLSSIRLCEGCPGCPNDCGWAPGDNGWGIHWVIAGGESGRRARPMHPDWARSLRDQCQAAGVPFLFKQWGEFGFKADLRPEVSEEFNLPPMEAPAWMRRMGKAAAGRLLDGREWNEFPHPGPQAHHPKES